MNKHKNSRWLSILIVANIVMSTRASQASDSVDVKTKTGSLSISCHELISGSPDPDGAVYSLSGDKLYREKIVISTENGIVLSSDNEDVISASHIFDGKKLTRTLYSQVGSHSKKVISVEVFDFKNQKITENGKDTCHHNGL